MRAALLAAVLAMSCRYDLDTREVQSACTVREDIAVCKEAESHSDYAWLNANLFSSNCSGDSCHSAPKAPSTKLPLGKILLAPSADNPDPRLAYNTLLGPSGSGAESDLEPGRKLVDPGEGMGGNPDNSYLLFLLHGIPASPGFPPLAVDAAPARPFKEPPSDIGYMPMDNNTLCCQKIDAVRRWIQAGAPEVEP
jgi:hypothetical protein